MAYDSLKKYLKDWFKVYHLHMAPEPIRKQLEKLLADDYDEITEETLEHYREFTGNDSLRIGERIYFNALLSGGQKLWFDKKTGKLADRPLPDIADLDIAEQRRFYRILRTTLRNINDNPAEYPNPDAPAKVATYLGEGKAFEEFKLYGAAGENANRVLKDFEKLVNGDEATEKPGDDILAQKLEEALGTQLGDDYSVAQFLKDLKSEPIRQKALNVVPKLISQVERWLYGYGADAINPELKNKLSAIFGDSEEREKLSRAVNQEGEPIDGTKFYQFLDPRVYGNLLKDLYSPDAKPDRKSNFAKDFEKHGGGPDIIKPMQLAVNHYNYDNLTGTYKKHNVNTVSQQFKKDWEDWTEEHVLKLWKRNLRHNYVEPLAKPVVDALCKAEVKPTSGLKGILEKRKEVEEKLTGGASPGSVAGFKFLCDTLDKISTAGDMKNTFNGALKNGKQAEAIAKEIITEALTNVPITGTVLEKARIALEILAVMRYDTLDSARGNGIQKNLMGADVFKDLSFMKHDGIKFVFNAAQKSFNLGMTGAFWITVMIRNTIQHSRGKINESEVETLSKSMDKIQENAASNMTLESVTRDLELAKNALAEFEKRNLYASGSFGETLDHFEKLKNKTSEELAEDARYDNIRDWVACIDGFLAKKTKWEDLPEELIQSAGLYINSKFGAVVLTQEQQLSRFKIELEQHLEKAMSPAIRAFSEGTLAIANSKLSEMEPLLEEYYQLQASVNIATEGYRYQKDRRGDRLEKMTKHNSGFDPHNEVQGLQSLVYFWNACNGYDFGLNINDYNLFKKHENQSQKDAFNAQVNSRLGKFDPDSVLAERS